MVDITKRLTEAMEAKGVSQADLASRVGVSRSVVHGWVHGDFVPKTDKLHRIALVLNVSEAWLMGIPGAMQQRVETLNEELSELIRIYKLLDVPGRTKLMAFAYNLEEFGGPKNGEL